jgi:hypothetical protein
MASGQLFIVPDDVPPTSGNESPARRANAGTLFLAVVLFFLQQPWELFPWSEAQASPDATIE